MFECMNCYNMNTENNVAGMCSLRISLNSLSAMPCTLIVILELGTNAIVLDVTV